MLGLILAATLAPSPADVLRWCDTPTTTAACRQYLVGFVHAAASYEVALEQIRGSAKFATVKMTCMPAGGVDVETLRPRVVASVRKLAKEAPSHPLLMLSAMQEAFPCPR